MTAETLADEHWEWFKVWLERAYKDAFIHGFKHGKQALKSDKK